MSVVVTSTRFTDFQDAWNFFVGADEVADKMNAHSDSIADIPGEELMYCDVQVIFNQDVIVVYVRIETHGNVPFE